MRAREFMIHYRRQSACTRSGRLVLESIKIDDILNWPWIGKCRSRSQPATNALIKPMDTHRKLDQE